MGACFSNTTSTATSSLPPPPPQFDVKPEVQQPHNTNNDQQPFKKEIFVIKHRISQESDRHTDKDNHNSLNPSATAGDGESRSAGGARARTSSCSKEEVDAILLQCGRLSRSNSTGAQNHSRKRRYSRSKRSFDFDLNMHLNDDDDVNDKNNGSNDGGLNHRHRHQEARLSSPSSRRSSRERDPRLCRSSSKERRISISPSRRSESPFRSVNTAAVPGSSGSGSNRPKMVSVPATDKSNNESTEPAVIGSVKRIHVKRNVGAASPRARSPAKSNLRIFTENPNHEDQTDTRDDEDDRLYDRRKSLSEIDNNAARSLQPSNPKKVVMVPTSVDKLMLRQNVRRLSRDLDKNPERILNPNSSPPSYASMLLEDIHNFHQKNMNASTSAPPHFSLPACVTKACSIMEAVADLNSNTSSFSEDRRINPTPISGKVVHEELECSIRNYMTMRQGASDATEEQESLGSNSITGSREINSTESREQDGSPFGEFLRELPDYPRKGIGGCGRRSIVAST